MNEQFTKQDLQTGDYIQIRNGDAGFVLKEQEYILYQQNGCDFFDMFEEDLKSSDGDVAFDIMKVYRAYNGDIITFLDFEDGDVVFERIDDIQIPAKPIAFKRPIPKKRIYILSQAFYGNRTGTEVCPEDLDRFILGYLDDKMEVRKPIDRTMILVPETENVYLIYNKYQEEETLKDVRKYNIKPLATINGQNIYSRVIACRIDENNEPQSLEIGDYEIVMPYLAQ